MRDAFIVALVMAIAPTVVGVVAWHQLTRKMDEIHALVNSNLMTVKENLATAVEEIATLKMALRKKTR